MKQPLAYIHPDAKIAPTVVIEPFVTIDKNVVIGVEHVSGQTLLYWKAFALVKIVRYFPEP